MTNEPFVRIENLTKTYLEGQTRRVVLRDAQADFARSASTAILGKSGSGKSTLLNLISGIDRPDRGRVWVDGQDLTSLDERQRTLFRRQKIGFVFQFFNLISTLTVGENVTLPLELNGLSRARARPRARALLAEVGLDDRWDTFPDKLSGGEQQRVALARALVHDPVLILADEPTGNLDEESGAQVLSLLLRLTHQQNHTLLIVTHSLEVAAHTDHVLRLAHAQLQTESPKDVEE
ncbi:MAG: ABC transporter ATP-binding protein [Anaerolineales bacterium]